MYDSVYYLRSRNMTKNTLNITFLGEGVKVPLYGGTFSSVENDIGRIFKTKLKYSGKLTEWELIHTDTTWEPYKKPRM
jgi:hypothetical protein